MTTTLPPFIRALREKPVHSPEYASRYGLDILSPDAHAFLSTSENPSASTFRLNQTHASGIVFQDWETASHSHPDAFARIGHQLRSHDALESHHLNHVQNGLFVFIPSHTRASSVSIPPLPFTFTHIFVHSESHSACTLLFTPSPHVPAHSTVIEVSSQPDSSLSILSLSPESTPGFRLAVYRATVSDRSSVNWFWLESGASAARLDVSAHLLGSHSSSHNVGLSAGLASQSLDIHQAAYHVGPSSHSKLVARGILSDSSKCVYRGLLNMVPAAKDGLGDQRADYLLISPKAEVDPVPALEIEGADVRCAQAATVGRLDKEKLFYLTSRGLPESAARALYIQGFLEHVLGLFPSNESLSIIRQRLSHALDVPFDSSPVAGMVEESA
ncbi:MAG: SufD family Fe-S cluster assembly protein [archaeon]